MAVSHAEQPAPLSAAIEAFIIRMPKIELHLHLEGSISSRTLRQLARRNGVRVSNLGDTSQLYGFQDFGEFLLRYRDLLRAVVSGEDFELLAYELGVSLAQQQVLYGEVMLSPVQHVLRGVDLYEAVQGCAAGFDRAWKEYGIVLMLAFDYGRQYGPDDAWAILEVAQNTRSYGMVGWSIGGQEPGYPPEPYAAVFAAAQQAGLHLMAHAGEVAGAASVWGAVDTLHVQRIGHGIRCIEDPALVAHLRERGTVLDICPTSNIFTGAVAHWEEHPIRQLFDAGVTVTVNSDDPAFFRTSITNEYRQIARRFGFTVDDLCQLVQASVNAAFLDSETRSRLGARVSRELAALRAELAV